MTPPSDSCVDSSELKFIYWWRKLRSAWFPSDSIGLVCVDKSITNSKYYLALCGSYKRTGD